MTTPTPPRRAHVAPRLLARKNVLAGLMFIGVAALGLVVSRHYPIGTTLRMGTGYVPRLLCWILLGLGAIVLVEGLRRAEAGPQAEGPRLEAPGVRAQLWPLAVVTASLSAFALSIEQLGLVVSVLLLVGIGALAARGLTLGEALAAALGLIVLSYGIFILGLGLAIPVWPQW